MFRNQFEINMPIKLLYIEDNPFSVRLMQLFLRRYQNYSLVIATNGQQGWEQTLSYEPDLILMDINLPDMTGWDLTRKLRSHPLTKHIPIIAITSVNLKRYHEMSLEAGMNLHLDKTTHHKQILKHIEDLLNLTNV
jgi:CheY-like chemotaxis protein